MSVSRICARLGAAVLAVSAMAASPAWAQDAAWYKDSLAMYEKMKKDAGGGAHYTYDQLPNWKGLWVKTGGTSFDSNAKQYEFTTAKLTPEYKARFEKKMADVKKGLEWDYMSYCLYPGYPRWLTEPFPKEFILTPEEAWLINEPFSDVRRVYINGQHIPDDEMYPQINGESIGFWDKDTLVIHTDQVRGGDYNRGQPEVTEQASTVERWRKVDNDNIEIEVWVWDPPALLEPWHVKMKYTREKTPGLRINIWSCTENNNVIRDPNTGATTFILQGEPGYRDPKSMMTEDPTVKKAPAK